MSEIIETIKGSCQVKDKHGNILFEGSKKEAIREAEYFEKLNYLKPHRHGASDEEDYHGGYDY